MEWGKAVFGLRHRAAHVQRILTGFWALVLCSSARSQQSGMQCQNHRCNSVSQATLFPACLRKHKCIRHALGSGIGTLMLKSIHLCPLLPDYCIYTCLLSVWLRGISCARVCLIDWLWLPHGSNSLSTCWCRVAIKMLPDSIICNQRMA